MSDEDEAVSGTEGAGGVSRRAGIIARFYAALDMKMREIENRIERAARSGAEELKAVDSERDARTLTALARLFEKLTELDGAESGSGKNANREEDNLAGKEIDAERFRREIADRIAFQPITFSASKDTPETIGQVRGHNAAWEAICGEKP